MKSPLKNGYYYLTKTWDFVYAAAPEEAYNSSPIKIWEIKSSKDYHLALEEAGFIRMNTEHTNIADIHIL